MAMKTWHFQDADITRAQEAQDLEDAKSRLDRHPPFPGGLWEKWWLSRVSQSPESAESPKSKSLDCETS